MRRQRENENIPEENEEFEDESLLPIQARKNAKNKSGSSSWISSTFVPSSTISSATPSSNFKKVAPWTQLADAMMVTTKPKPTTKNENENDIQPPQPRQQHLHTGLAYHRDCANHMPRRHPFAGEFEIPERTTFTMQHIHECGLDGICAPIPVVEATYERLARVHDPNHIQQVNGTVVHGIQSLANVAYAGDLYVSSGTARAARLAAGGVAEAALKVCRGELQNAMCIVRPPGHHCPATKASGFCFFNNVAVAARAAQSEVEGVERVLVVDWDVHHGDGTEAVFYDDPSVCVVSVHQHHFGKGHVFHRPAKEELPGYDKVMMMRKALKQELQQNQEKEQQQQQVEFSNINNTENKEGEEVAADADELMALLDEFDENEHEKEQQVEKEKSKEENISQKETTTIPETHNNSRPERGARRAAATSMMMELLAAEKQSQEQQQQQPTNEIVIEKKNESSPEQPLDEDAAAMALFATVFGNDKLKLKNKQKKLDDVDSDSDSSSRNTSSINSQKLDDSEDDELNPDAALQDDDEDEEEEEEEEKENENNDASPRRRRNRRSEHQKHDNDEYDDQGESDEDDEQDDGLPKESPLESHTGPKFNKTYKKRAAPFYPGTGHVHRVGTGAGLGRNINCPWPCTGFGDVEYIRIINELVIPVAKEFKPDLIIISCGMDCCAGDLLGSMKVTPTGVFLMTSLLSEKVTPKVVVALEGGYMLRNVALCAEAAIRALLQFSTQYTEKNNEKKKEDDDDDEKKIKLERENGTHQKKKIPHSTMLYDQTSRLIEDVKMYHSPYWKCFQHE